MPKIATTKEKTFKLISQYSNMCARKMLLFAFPVIEAPLAQKWTPIAINDL